MIDKTEKSEHLAHEILKNTEKLGEIAEDAGANGVQVDQGRSEKVQARIYTMAHEVLSQDDESTFVNELNRYVMDKFSFGSDGDYAHEEDAQGHFERLQELLSTG